MEIPISSGQFILPGLDEATMAAIHPSQLSLSANSAAVINQLNIASSTNNNNNNNNNNNSANNNNVLSLSPVSSVVVCSTNGQLSTTSSIVGGSDLMSAGGMYGNGGGMISSHMSSIMADPSCIFTGQYFGKCARK